MSRVNAGAEFFPTFAQTERKKQLTLPLENSLR